MPESQDQPIQAENTQPAADLRSEAREAGTNVAPSFHAWLAGRIASLDRKRKSAWQKLCSFLLGK